jgi:glutamine synthetase
MKDTLDRPTADAIAHAMKRWALENGATHFTHWFQPMTGGTAEKHDAFLEPDETESRLHVSPARC